MGSRGRLILMEMAGRGRARVRVSLRAKRVRPFFALFLDFEKRPDFPHDALTPLQGALGAERAPGFQHLLLDLLGLRGRPLDEARELVHALVEEREHGNGAVDPLVQVLVREVGVFVAQEDTQLDIRVPLDHPGEHRDVVEGVAEPVLREEEDLDLRAQPVERCAVLRLDFDLAQELDELFLVRPHLVQVLLERYALREPLLRDHGSPLRGSPRTAGPRSQARLACGYGSHCGPATSCGSHDHVIDSPRTAGPQPRDVLRLARPRHPLASDRGAPAPRRPAARTTTSSPPGESDPEPAHGAPRGNAPAPRRPAARTTTSSHRGEIDREPADVAPVGIAHDQRDPRRLREVPRGEAVDAAGEVPPVLLPCRGPLVLDEGRLDLAVGHEQSGRVEAREVLARALEPRPEQEAILLLAQELVRRVGLQGLVPEGRVARRQDEPVERREHGDALTRSVRHTPLRVERLDGHRARADAERILALAGRERERRCARRRSQEQRAEDRGDGESGATHGIRPTTTRLNDSAAKNRWAARWTSRAVTRETPAL